jgi:hypothetical protein
MHLKFVTLVTPSVEKITKLHGFKHLDNSLLIEGYQMGKIAVVG